MSAYISGYGVSIPLARISVKDIHQAWQNIPWVAVEARGVREHTVLGPDEDTITLAADAATSALKRSGVKKESIGALFLGTQTSPYLTRPSATIVAEMLGLKREVFAVDLQFSGKSGSAALLNSMAWVLAGMTEAALAIGADTLSYHVAPGDTKEYTAASAGAAVVVTAQPGPVELGECAYYSSDTPDGFRLDGDRFIRTGGASMNNTDVGLPLHVSSAWEILQKRADLKPTDVDFVVMPQVDGRSGAGVARRLGFSKEKIEPADIASSLGDCGAASSLLALAAVFDQVKKGQKVVLLSYGMGAGSDALVLKVREEFSPGPKVKEMMARKKMVDYPTYIKLERKYHTTERRFSTFD